MSSSINIKKEKIVDSNSVLTNTYKLLAMTLAFSAITAGLAVMIELGSLASLVFSLISLGLIFVVIKKSKSESGLYWTFAFSGTMGLSLGSMLTHYLSIDNGATMIMQSLTMTAIVFFSLSAYVLKTKKDFSFMRGFLMAGLIVVLLAILANIFFQITMLSLITSSIVVLLMSGYILYDTSRIINGGETNYIMATISLYLNIFNIFVHLLNIFGILNDD